MKIVVIGGTGLIGSKLVRRARASTGTRPCAASPNTGVNTLTGEGLAEVLAGAAVVVDVSNSPSFEDAAVLEFFETSTRNLLEAETAAGVGHHVALSIVGTDRLPGERLLPGQDRPGAADRDVGYPVLDRARDAVLRVRPGHRRRRRRRRPRFVCRPRASSPSRATTSRTPSARVALGTRWAATSRSQARPLPDGRLLPQALAALGDARPVVTDPHARYFGSELQDDSLVPVGPAQLGRIHYADWHRA